MNEEYEVKNFEDDETVEFDLEELAEVQGGIEGIFGRGDCGLGCFVGAGYGPI